MLIIQAHKPIWNEMWKDVETDQLMQTIACQSSNAEPQAEGWDLQTQAEHHDSLGRALQLAQ